MTTCFNRITPSCTAGTCRRPHKTAQSVVPPQVCCAHCVAQVYLSLASTMLEFALESVDVPNTLAVAVANYSMHSRTAFSLRPVRRRRTFYPQLLKSRTQLVRSLALATTSGVTPGGTGTSWLVQQNHTPDQSAKSHVRRVSGTPASIAISTKHGVDPRRCEPVQEGRH